MSERAPLLGHAHLIAPKALWRIGAAFAAFGIVAGAFGAHGLRKRPDIDADRVHAWETAAHYSVFNGLGLMLVSQHPRFSTHRFAGPAIVLGGFVFSSSILLLILARDRFKALGPITPVGGVILIAGYTSLIF